MFKKFFSNKKGFGLVEIIVFITILGVSLVALFNAGILSSRITSDSHQKIRAALLMEEGMEVIRLMRDRGWSNIPAPAEGTIITRCVEFTGTDYSISASTCSSKIDGIFTRTAEFIPVYRNANDDIVLSGSIPDANTRLVEIEISWKSRGGVESENLQFYITNLFGT